MKKHLLALLLLGSTASAQAAILVSGATGNLSQAGTWLLVNNNNWPDSYTGANQVNWAASAAYTDYFTPSNATDTNEGVIIYIYQFYPYAVSTTVTANLMEGAVVRATATVVFGNRDLAVTANDLNYGGGSGWFHFKFATPYQYGNTTAGTWRYKFTNSPTSQNTYVRKNGTYMAYGEVLTTTQAPATGDSLIICGAGTTANSISTYTVTVDSSITLGTTATTKEAINISKGGELTWGSSQTSSYTITCNNNIRGTSSNYDTFGLRMGSSLAPLTSTYIQTLVFNNTTANRYGLVFSDENNSATNSSPFRASIYGDYRFNQASDASWMTTLASTAPKSATSLVLTDDIGARVGGGDRLLLSSTYAGRTAENVVISSYTDATKVATLTTPLISTHSAGAYVWAMSANAVIKSSSSVLASRIYGTAAASYSSTKPRIEISNLELEFVNQCLVLYPDANSYMNYIRSWNRTSDATNSGYPIGMAYGTTNKVVMHMGHATISPYNMPGMTNNYQVFFDTAGLTYGLDIHPSYGNQTYNNCYFDSTPIYVEPSFNRFNNCKQWGSSTYGMRYTSNQAGIRVENSTFGTPIKNANEDFAIYPSVLSDMVYVNNTFYGTTPIDTTNLANSYPNSAVKMQAYGGNGTDNRIYRGEGVIQTSGAGLSDITTRTTGQIALRFAPWTSHPNTTSPLSWTVKKAVAANNNVTWYGYMRKNTSYGSTNLPYISLTSGDSVINSSSTLTDVNDTWQIFSVAGTVGSTDTYVSLGMYCPSTQAGSAFYLSDMQLVVGNGTVATGYKVGTIWKDGEPTADDTLGGTIDPGFLRSTLFSTYGTDAAMAAATAALVPSISTTTVAEGVWKYQLGQSTSTIGGTGRWIYKGLPDKIKSDIR